MRRSRSAAPHPRALRAPHRTSSRTQADARIWPGHNAGRTHGKHRGAGNHTVCPLHARLPCRRASGCWLAVVGRMPHGLLLLLLITQLDARLRVVRARGWTRESARLRWAGKMLKFADSGPGCFFAARFGEQVCQNLPPRPWDPCVVPEFGLRAAGRDRHGVGYPGRPWAWREAGHHRGGATSGRARAATARGTTGRHASSGCRACSARQPSHAARGRRRGSRPARPKVTRQTR